VAQLQQLGQIVQTGFAHHVLLMFFHGAFRQKQLLGDLRRRQAPQQTLQHLQLLGGEIEFHRLYLRLHLSRDDPLPLRQPLQGFQYHFGAVALVQEALGGTVQQLAQHRTRPRPRQKHHAHLGPALLQTPQGLQRIHLRHVVVQQDTVRRLQVLRLQQRFGTVEIPQNPMIAPVAQEQRQ